MQKLDHLLTQYLEKLFDFIPQVVTAIIIAIIGLWLIKFIKHFTNKIFLKREIDPTFTSFISDVLIWGMRVLLFVVIASKLGIQTTSFVAILGAMSLAIGLSLQGSLSNFAGGVLIILFKPFRIGDTIQAQGEVGKVIAIHIFSTQIINSQNDFIYIPNGILSNGKIKNSTENNLRKTEVSVSTNLVKDTNKFISLLQEQLECNDKIMLQPKPKVVIIELLDAKITYSVQVWVNNQDYGAITSYILLKAREISDQI